MMNMMTNLCLPTIVFSSSFEEILGLFYTSDAAQRTGLRLKSVVSAVVAADYRIFGIVTTNRLP